MRILTLILMILKVHNYEQELAEAAEKPACAFVLSRLDSMNSLLSNITTRQGKNHLRTKSVQTEAVMSHDNCPPEPSQLPIQAGIKFQVFFFVCKCLTGECLACLHCLSPSLLPGYVPQLPLIPWVSESRNPCPKDAG